MQASIAVNPSETEDGKDVFIEDAEHVQMAGWCQTSYSSEHVQGLS